MEKALGLRSRPVGALATLVVLALMVTAIGAARSTSSSSDHPGIGLSTTEAAAAVPRMPATQFRVSSFNLLGAGHTEPGGDKPGYASGYTRMGWSVQLLLANAIDIVGFQEMRPVQVERFLELEGKNFGLYPGNQLTAAAGANSIAWRKDTWTLIQPNTIQIPYFNGSLIRMPYLLMQNQVTGQRAWFANFHNPASPPKYGDQEKWRDKATELEIGLVNRLRDQSPSYPVVFTGDFNERDEFFCRVSRRTELRAANGGGIKTDGTCVPPAKMPVDWILGTPDVSFTGYQAQRTELVQKTTDHPLIFSAASVAPGSVQQSPITRVVAVSIEGLRSRVFSRLSATEIPTLTRLVANGASTLNARTVTERTTSLPNDLSMLTGRRVSRSVAGHGVRTEADGGGTVHAAAGHYISSVFDIVHDFGRGTALFSNRKSLRFVDRSWAATNGGPDRHGLDQGTDKIDRYVEEPSAGALVNKVVAQLAARPRAFTFVQLADLDRVGHASGFRSPAYLDAVRRMDAFLRRILRAINGSTRLAGRTLLVVTSEHGGNRRDHTDPTVRANYQVPFIVWGPGVQRGANLYTLNPHYTSPGSNRAGYGSPPPIRNAFLANLVTMALRLPAVPGSTFNREQDLNVFVGP